MNSFYYSSYFQKFHSQKKMIIAIRNESLKFKNSKEINFGSATLRFDETGTRILANVNDVPKENLVFYLKNGENLTEIPDKDLIKKPSKSVKFYDSSILNVTTIS